MTMNVDFTIRNGAFDTIESEFMNKKVFKKYIPSQILNARWFIIQVLTKIFFYLNKRGKKHTYAGVPLKIYIFDEVSRNWYDHDWQRNEIEFLKKGKLKEGARVFDIGAHQGIVALIFSKIVGTKGNVVAVEMDKSHIQIAEINKKNNNANNLRLVHAAAGAKKGKLFFDNDQVKIEKNSRLISINATTIDTLTLKYGAPSVLYIDVEGYEAKVLKGAKKTMQQFPDCCIEVHANNGLEVLGGSVEELISFFPKKRYNLYMATATHRCKIQHFNLKNNLTKNRFYLIALAYNSSNDSG